MSDVSRVRNKARSTVVESTNPLLDRVLECNGSYVVGTAASARQQSRMTPVHVMVAFLHDGWYA